MANADSGVHEPFVVARDAAEAARLPSPLSDPSVPNLACTPHSAWCGRGRGRARVFNGGSRGARLTARVVRRYSRESRVEMRQLAAAHVADLIAGRPPRSVVNAEFLTIPRSE